MRNVPNLRAEKYRVTRQEAGEMATGPEDGNNGAFVVPCRSIELHCIVSDRLGWDHVSVSLAHRTPTWEEMCVVKDLFFRDDECVMQLHPPKADHRSDHPYTLHLWAPNSNDIDEFTAPLEIPRPPAWMVGRKEGQSTAELFAEARAALNLSPAPRPQSTE